MADLSKATPRPWSRSVFMVKAGHDNICQTGYSSSLGPSRSDEAEANAALIVKAVNLHEKLVEMLRDVLPWITAEARVADDIYDKAKALLAKAEAE